MTTLQLNKFDNVTTSLLNKFDDVKSGASAPLLGLYRINDTAIDNRVQVA